MVSRTRLLLFLMLVTACSLGYAQFAVPVARPTRPIPAIEHVLVIGIDGLRPDRLLLADTPTMHDMIRNGAYTFWARTTYMAVTLPSFTSMMTGVNPRKHMIEWDRDLPFATQVYPKVPTIFEMASKVGYVTAMTAGKSKFVALNKPGTITHCFIPTDDVIPESKVVDEAVKIIESFKPNFMFVHLPGVDTVGHAKGWGSHEQLAQIAETDGHVARVLAALDRAGIRGSTCVILSADHGGQGLTHGPEDFRSRHIPWIANGPGVRKFDDLTQHADLEVRTEDTCATACWLLGLPQQPYFDGHPVYQAFETVR